MIEKLWNGLLNGLRELGAFLAVVSLGFLVAIVWVLPWLIRATSIVTWIGGAYLAGETISAIYGPISERIPLMALWTIPAILAAALPVWLHYKGQLARIWGSFFLFGLLCWGFQRGAAWLLGNWQHGDMFFRAAPALLVASLVIFAAIRFRMLRMVSPQSGEGGLNDPICSSSV
jgi:hypothetical protein